MTRNHRLVIRLSNRWLRRMAWWGSLFSCNNAFSGAKLLIYEDWPGPSLRSGFVKLVGQRSEGSFLTCMKYPIIQTSKYTPRTYNNIS